jgi:hypothetical protein
MIAFLYLYLANQITGRQLVAEIDRLVSDDLIEGLSEECIDDFDGLHEKMALCVWDNQTYDDSPGLYINDEELSGYVEKFLEKWSADIARLVCKNSMI